MQTGSNPENNRPYSQDFSGESKTDRSFGPACDVNNIVRHYHQTGMDPYIARKQLESYGYATSRSYEDAQRQVAEVNSAFEMLPAAERAEHQNDPATWVESVYSQTEEPDPAIPEVGPPGDRPADVDTDVSIPAEPPQIPKDAAN